MRYARGRVMQSVQGRLVILKMLKQVMKYLIHKSRFFMLGLLNTTDDGVLKDD